MKIVIDITVKNMINIAAVTDEKITCMDDHHAYNSLIGLWTGIFQGEYHQIMQCPSLSAIASHIAEKREIQI